MASNPIAAGLEPAFGRVDALRFGDRESLKSAGGVTVRDYFAAKAMHAELNTAGANDDAALALAAAAARVGQTIEGRIAANSYRMADAMLIARAGRGDIVAELLIIAKEHWADIRHFMTGRHCEMCDRTIEGLTEHAPDCQIGRCQAVIARAEGR